MTIGKTASQIERKLTERLRGNASLAMLYRVVVVPQNAGAWTTQCLAKMGMTISPDCTSAVNAIERDLRRQFHLEAGY
jgi:cation transport ATPase